MKIPHGTTRLIFNADMSDSNDSNESDDLECEPHESDRHWHLIGTSANFTST